MEANVETAMVGLLKKQLLYSRIITGVLAALLITVVIVSATVLPGVNRTVDAAETLIAQASGTLDDLEDVDIVLANLSQVTQELADADLTGSLEGIDALVAQSEVTLSLAFERIEAMDIETLNTAIEDLGAVVAPIAKLFGK